MLSHIRLTSALLTFVTLVLGGCRRELATSRPTGSTTCHTDSDCTAGGDCIEATCRVRCADIGACGDRESCIDGHCLPVPASTCGDGVVQGAEACDDGDSEGGDGCDAACAIEEAFACTGEPSSCERTRGALGTRCADASDCSSGFCVDGVCCESACDGTCMACSAAGSCDSVPMDDDACGVVDCPADTDCRDYAEDMTSGRCAGLGQCKTASDCGHVDMPATTICRPTVGACDTPEHCDGASADCPSDALLAGGTECRAAAGACDIAESCDGATVDCPQDAVQDAWVECRPAGGPCDVAEVCDGMGVECPGDGVLGADVECRAAAGACDVAEQCDGASIDCPSDSRRASDTECRPAAGACDTPERCDGASADCPADAKRDATTECRAAVSSCDAVEYCDGSSDYCSTDVSLADDAVCGAAGACLSGTCCGDGVVDPSEDCDDGAIVDGDGCSASCVADPDWVCSGEPSACTPLCGNGVQDGSETGVDCGGAGCRALGLLCGVGQTCADSADCSTGACDSDDTCKLALRDGPCTADVSCLTGLSCSGGSCLLPDGGACSDGGGCVSGYCNGNGSCATPDVTPDAFGFVDRMSQPTSTLVTSDEVVLSGFDGSLEVFLTSAAGAMLRVNGGSWVTTASAAAGDKLQVQVTSSASYSSSVSVQIDVGTGSDVWTVATAADPAPAAFSGTGADQSFVVPSECTRISVKLWGAAGGGTDTYVGIPGHAGGGGGYAGGDIAVSPNETLTIIVGKSGQYHGAATYGGGGSCPSNSSTYDGTCGGGRSAIRRGSTELITAGGGGGSSKHGAGGAGGGSTGGSGGGTSPGSGGTESAGGTGSQSGSQFQGGNAPGGSTFGGAAGGGGYYGGGSGASGASSSGAGGGGSGYLGGVAANGVLIAGSGSTPGNASDGDRNGAGEGVANRFVAGNDGRVVIRCQAVDGESPTTPGSFDDGTSATTTTSPLMSWTAGADNVAVVGYDVALGTLPGATDVMMWTSVGNASSAQLSGLALALGTTYYATIRARDAAGNVSPAAIGDGFVCATLDATPDAFVFADLTNQTLSTTVTSNVITLTGFTGPVSVGLSGDASGTLSINGGSWTTSGSVSPGDTLQLRVTTGSAYGASVELTVNVGDASDTWTATTQLVAPTYASCLAIRDAGASTGSGTYTIDPDGAGGLAAFDVHCNMTSQGGGWTLVLARQKSVATTTTTGVLSRSDWGSAITDARWQALATLATKALVEQDSILGLDWGIADLAKTRSANCRSLASSLTAPVIAWQEDNGCTGSGVDYCALVGIYDSDTYNDYNSNYCAQNDFWDSLTSAGLYYERVWMFVR